MRLTKTFLISILILFSAGNYQLVAQDSSVYQKLLGQSFQLDGNKSNQQQFFISETEVKTFNANGTIATKDIYKLYLKYVPAKISENEMASYTCSKFEIISNDTVSKTVPILNNWSYTPYLAGTAMDENEQVFGIDHTKFENLVDDNNNPFPPDKSYFIYNTFIDFHAFCNVFAEKTLNGKGIQDLHKIGDEIIHSASHSKPPVNLGSSVKEGSYFQNGLVTLGLKGLSIVNNNITVIVHFDSGESSFNMIMEPITDMIVDTQGSSHYFGDIFIDPYSHWVQKVIMHEIVVAQSKLPLPPNEINSVTERRTEILNISNQKYEYQLLHQ